VQLAVAGSRRGGWTVVVVIKRFLPRRFEALHSGRLLQPY
jgi:hypothetical protein